MATDIHWYCSSPVTKIFDSFFRNSSLMQKICSGLSSFGFISETDTSEPFPLHSRGSNPIPSHVPAWRRQNWSGVEQLTLFRAPHLYLLFSPEQTSFKATPLTWTLQKHMAIALLSKPLPVRGPSLPMCESQLPGQQHELKNHTESQKHAYSLLPVSEYSWIPVQPAQEASSLHIQQTPPKLAKWFQYLLANSCVLVENIHVIIFAVCLKS